MKKLFLVGIIVLSVAFIAACTETGEDTTQTNEDIISMQALTTATLLQKSNNQLLSEDNQDSIMRLTEHTTETTSVDTGKVVEQIEPYVELVEQYLGSNDGLNISVEDSTMAEYETMMTFESVTLTGDTQVYVIHYNMTLIEDEDDDEDDEEETEEETEEKEEESEFALDGIMIVGDDTYQLTGNREVELYEEEVEFIAMLDDDNYVTSSYSIETEEGIETEYEIEIVKNGETISETSIEIEDTDGERKIELEFENVENSGSYSFKYEMENDQPVLKVEFDVTIDGVEDEGEMTLSIHTDDVTGETYYMVYREMDDDDYEERYERELDDDDDDDDDDE